MNLPVTIYLCKRLDKSSNDAVIQRMIHELAHFVGHPEHIADFGCGWIDDPRMKRLVPSQRILTAESYCNYAFDARYNRPPKESAARRRFEKIKDANEFDRSRRSVADLLLILSRRAFGADRTAESANPPRDGRLSRRENR